MRFRNSLQKSVFGVLFAGCALAQGRPEHTKNLAPYVVSPQIVVDKMLEAARLRPGETVYDLGCGDGRVLVTAVRKFNAAKAVGVEISQKLVNMAMETIRALGPLQDRARVMHADLMDVDVSEADVVTLYLLTESNAQLRPKLEKSLKPGARVVSHEFKMRGWDPVRVEKAPGYRHVHTIYVYEMPAGKQE